MSVSALCGSIFMGLAGGVGLLNVSFDNLAYAFLSAGGLVGSAGHIFLMSWGKGSASDAGDEPLPTRDDQRHSLVKPFMPWHYPIDSAFVLFMLGNSLFIFAGIAMGNYALSGNGFLAATASAVGWLWPEKKTWRGFHSMQISALLFLLATISNFFAAFLEMNLMILVSSCCFLLSNLMLYTIRKETQSSYTQAHG